MKKFYSLLGLIFFVIIVNAQNPLLYALTSAGGASGKGAIIKYDVSSNQLTASYSFAGPDGEAPQGSLVQATNGLFYGMTRNGGANNLGVIFSFNPYTNSYTRLYDFGGVDGARPHGSLIQANNGILYGMTTYGGIMDRGVIFSYNIQESVYTKLYNFTGPVDGRETPNADDGSLPYGSLVQATDGKLYGMTSNGGLNYFGIAFSFDIASSSLVKFLHFGLNGGPMASFIQAADGFLYYTTNGGAGESSRVWLGYLGSTKPGFVTHPFGTATGTHPLASLLEASDGKLYGTTTKGGILTNPGTITFGAIYSYDHLTYEYKAILFNGADGDRPGGSLMQASNGKLYGMTTRGGINNLGVVYSLDITTFTRSKLQDFNGSNGANPELGHFTELKIKCTTPVVSIADAKAMQKGVEANTVYKGYAPASGITLEATTAEDNGYSFLWSNGATTKSIYVSPGAATTYSVTVTNTSGCTATASKEVNVVDVRCGNGNDKVMVCKVQGNKAKENVLCISPGAVAAQITGGALLGSCGTNTVASKENTLEILASPNPTSSSFTLSIKSKSNEAIQLVIYDAMGRAIETRTIKGNQSLQMGSSYKAGIYYIEAVQGKEKESVKVVKSK